MARSIKWQCEFKSFHDKDCTVNILVEGYSGTIKQLVGAANPFYWEEDDDNNPQTMVRSKTGYLNVIETSEGELKALMPAEETSHYIEAYYDGKLVFTGYMQAVEFGFDNSPCPRELNYPIQSPFGLLESFEFDVREASMSTPGKLMGELITKLNAGYERVIYPSVRDDHAHPFNCIFPSEIICPHSELDLSYINRDTSFLYEPKNLKFFLEGMCQMMNWQVHDCCNAIVFTQENFNGEYYNILTSNLNTCTATSYAQVSGSSLKTVLTCFDELDAEGSITQIRPYAKATVKLDDETFEKVELKPFNYTNGNIYSGGIGYTLVGGEVYGDNIRRPSFIYNELVNAGEGLYPVTIAKHDDSGAITTDTTLLYMYDANAPKRNSLILGWKLFPRLPLFDGNFKIKMSLKVGTSVQSLESNWSGSDLRFQLRLKCGDKYYNESTRGWVNEVAGVTFTVNHETGSINSNGSTFGIDGEIDGYYLNFRSYSGMVPANDIIELQLWFDTTNPGIANGTIIQFDELSAEIVRPWSSKVLGVGNDDGEKVYKNPGGVGELSYALNFFDDPCFKKSICLAEGGVWSIDLPLPYGVFSSHYIFTNNYYDKQGLTNPHSEYMYKWMYWRADKTWRVIAKRFKMIDDETTLILKSI